MQSMINSLNRMDVVVVKFPFASSIKYKARPAVIISNSNYNQNSRNTFIILAISSKIDNKLNIEKEISNWKEAGLLKPSIIKSSIATIEANFIIQKLGRLSAVDIVKVEQFIDEILKDNNGSNNNWKNF